MKTTYELTSKAREGSLKLSYDDNGILNAFEIDFKPALDETKMTGLLRKIPASQIFVYLLKDLGLEINKALAPNEKLALFCRVYEKHIGIKYKVTAADSGKIKQINPTEEQLHAYFRSENFLFKGKQSISNLVKYWNEFRADLAGQGKSKFPDEWNADLIKKLTPQDTIHYYSHLRSLGLKAVKSEAGQVVGFK
tara:strand:+ start:1307 stop:1888 length:582 start_codon:yes stop_codon:yes gene_type:complete